MKKTIAGGVWPVMITPFTEDNRIDYDAVLRIIEWYDKNGLTESSQYVSPVKCLS